MASFTDRIPQFNEYVAQQPVQAMVEVGMAKQQQYDTNLQKIQQSMSQVGGLNVMRDLDKRYLKNKMDSVSNQLQVFAGSDLSNGSLASQLNGMVGGIANDEIVQNSVRSSMNVQKAMSLQEKYNSEGKGSPSNDWLLGTQIENYLNDGKEGASFNASYKPYQDYKKNTLDIIKGLTGNERITEDAFHYEGNRLVIHDAIARSEMSGVTAEQIQQAVLTGLSPADWEQIQTDGRYQYSGEDGESFGIRVENQYNDEVKSINDDIDALVAKDLSSQNGVEKKNIQEVIKLKRNELQKSKRKYKGILESINNGNFESAKAELFTKEFMNGMSQAFSYSKQSLTYKTNPYAQQENFRQRIKLDNYWKEQEYNQRAAKIIQDQENFIKTYNQKQTEIDGDANFGAGLTGLRGAVDQNMLPKFVGSSVRSELREQSVEIQKLENKIKRAIGVREGEGNIDKTFDEILQTYINKNEVSPVLKKNIEELISLKDTNAKAQESLHKVTTFLDKKYPKISELLSEEDQNTLIGIDVTDNDGRITEKVNFTVSEVVEFNELFSSYVRDTPKEDDRGFLEMFQTRPLEEAIDSQFDLKRAKNTLTPGQFFLFKAKAKQQLLGPKGRRLLSPPEKTALKYSKDYNSYNEEYSDILKNRLEEEGELLRDRFTTNQKNTYAFEGLTNTELNQVMREKLSVVSTRLFDQGGFSGYDGDKEKFDKLMASDIQGASMSVKEADMFNPAQYQLTINSKEQGTQVITLNEEDKRTLFPGEIFEATPELNFQNKWDNILNQNSLNGISDDYLDMPEGVDIPYNAESSTAESLDPYEKTTAANAGIRRTEFPNVNVFNMNANLRRTDRSKYTLEYNVMDFEGMPIIENISFPAGGLLQGEKLQAAFNGLNDDIIFETIYGIAPKQTIRTREDLNKEIEELLKLQEQQQNQN